MTMNYEFVLKVFFDIYFLIKIEYSNKMFIKCNKIFLSFLFIPMKKMSQKRQFDIIKYQLVNGRVLFIKRRHTFL